MIRYRELFLGAKQYGKLYVVGTEDSLFIQALPLDNEIAIPNGNGKCLNENAIEVYGEVREGTYGWLEVGPWIEDFDKLVVEVINDSSAWPKKSKNELDKDKGKRKRKDLLRKY